MIRAFVLAATPMMQAGLRTMLTAAGVQVVGEASNSNTIVAEMPDIDVIVVADEQQLEGIGSILAGNRFTPPVAIVVLSNNDEQPLSLLSKQSLRGWGIIPGDAPTAQLQAVVLAASQGFIVLPTASAEQLLSQHPITEEISPGSLDEPLTGREREVLELVSRGLPNKLIARRLQISEHTVKFHVSSIYTKLGASSRTDAVNRGVRRGLITL